MKRLLMRPMLPHQIDGQSIDKHLRPELSCGQQLVEPRVRAGAAIETTAQREMRVERLPEKATAIFEIVLPLQRRTIPAFPAISRRRNQILSRPFKNAIVKLL